MGKVLKQENVIKNMSNRHNNKFDYSKVIYQNSRSPITIICPKHGEFTTTYEAHMRDTAKETGGCRKCVNELTSSRFLIPKETIKARIEEVHKGKGYIVDYNSYGNTCGYVWVECPKHGKWYANVGHFLHGHGCPKCGIEQRTRTQSYTKEDFIRKAREKHGDKYDYSKVVYRGTDIPVEIICPLHGVFWQRPHNHITKKAQGCPECWKTKHPSLRPKQTEIFIKDARAIHGDKYNYDKVEYINNKTPVIVICPEHGEFKVRPDNHLIGKTGCPVCSSSKPEKIIYNFLTKHKIKFIYQYKLDYFEYRWDFYISDLNLVIEYNGEQHERSIKGFGNLEAQKAVDHIKKEILKYNHINLEVIDHRTRLDDLPVELSLRLSKYAHYCYNGNFYKNLTTLGKVIDIKDKPIEFIYPFITKNLYKQ
jgi:hypothetical protein|nr:MAG TPA: restriction enzyme [Caudoviricetes sp.]